MAKRRKADAKILPQTDEEAILLGSRYLDLMEGADRIRADADVAILTIKNARDELLLPVEDEMKTTFLILRDWWAANVERLTDGKRKSREIGGLMMGIRLTPPSIRHLGTKAEDLALDLKNLGLSDLIKVNLSLAKPALLAALKRDDDISYLLAWMGIDSVQKDEFFIDRAVAAEVSPEVIETEEDAA